VTRSGNLTVNANGTAASFTPGTGNSIQVGGGGGAGGTIVLFGTGGTIAANTNGGDGATAQRVIHRAHGGGGGGGAIFASGALTGIASAATGGRAGCTVAGTLDTEASNCNGSDIDGSTQGTDGAASTFAASSGPGSPSCEPAAISVTKSNASTSVTAGQITVYDLVVVNDGPAAANNTRLTDPPAAGLACTSVACTSSTPGGICPAPAAVTIGNLQGAGVVLSSLPANSTLTFQVTCGATATGQ